MSAPPSRSTLQIRDLTVAYRQQGRWLPAVRDFSLDVAAGQTYGLVGESGSGKSTLALAIMRSLSPNGAVRQGEIRLEELDLLAQNQAQMRHLWAHRLKLVPQNALSALNPALRIRQQLAEALRFRADGAGPQQVLELLATVRLADPQRVADSYPHELSGGMQQRVMIAMALSAEPALLVLDEPTTSLDVTTAAAILDLMGDLIRARATAVLYVSHDLGVVARICDRVAVLYAGELVEDAPVTELYRHPLHPYTAGLLNSVPRVGQNKYQGQLQPIPGTIPHLHAVPAGCVFAPRCPLVIDLCWEERPSWEEPAAGHRVRCHRWPAIQAGEVGLRADAAEGVGPRHTPVTRSGEAPGAVTLEMTGVTKRFTLPRSLGELLRRRPPRSVRAVDGVDLAVRQGHTLGLVGESGSGKTTLARCIIGLVPRSDGQICLDGVTLAPAVGDRTQELRRRMQMVFQNPDEALNPYMRVGQALRRPLMHLRGYDRARADAAVERLLAAVNLRPEYAARLPGELSGGEKQRVAIARAFASEPRLILFDESVSALDVSVQASILNLLNHLQTEHGSAYLFITHDLGVVSYLADEIAVIYLGRLMEVGPAAAILSPPFHPYTEALLSAVSLVDPTVVQEQIRLDGEVPSPVNLPSGCPFHTRCPRSLGAICVEQEPPWQEAKNGQRIFCHIPLADLVAAQVAVVPGGGHG